MLSSTSNSDQYHLQRCFHFERGHCRRGRNCHFIHSREDNYHTRETNDGSLNCQSLLPVEHFSASAHSGHHGKKFVKACRNYRQKGWCAFGNSCVFLHADPGRNCEQTSTTLKSTAAKSSFDQQVIRDATSSLENKSNKPLGNGEKKVCRFYRSGYCRQGAKCHYQHTRPRLQKSQCNPNDECEEIIKNELEIQEENSVEGITVGKPYSAASNGQDGSTSMLQSGGNRCNSDVHLKDPYQGHVKPQVSTTPQQDLQRLRDVELQQFRRRYPKAQELQCSGQATFKFVFEPTDPDWPYDVKQMMMEVLFPENYPVQMMVVQVKGNERIPATVERSLTESITSWITQRYDKAKETGIQELMFRPFLQWLDKTAEDLMTDALKEYKRELMAKAAGMEFIPAVKLRQIYPEAVQSRSQSGNDETTPSEHQQASDEGKSQTIATETERETSRCESENEKENDPQDVILCEQMTANKKGTEVSLLKLQLTDSAATLVASQITLIVACVRCTNTTEVHLSPGHAYRAACSRCHVDHLMMFNASIAHQMSSVIGWLNLEGCRAFDMVLADCQFLVGCISCSKEEKINSISPGHPNNTWCRHCHQKLTLFVESVRFVQLSASAEIDVSKAIQVVVKKPVKNVRDPAIQEGQPLPKNGTCKHYKKSFRWLRFPCCGKAYPCDRCHNENETDHEMKLANRMICGFCAKEQAYASEKPCVACSNIMTNKSTAHWEGGKGCRDQIKMARNDSKKYTNVLKTVSSSSSEKTDVSKKTTKLRHV